MIRFESLRLPLFIAWSLLAFSTACSREPAPAVDPDHRSIITGVTLLSAERAEPLEDAWVGLEGERIAEVGSGTPGERWAEAETIDGAGRFLSPGLIDSHVHLLSIPGLPIPTPWGLRGMARDYRRQLPRSYLYFGFTTLIDLNVVDFETLESFSSAPAAPDLFHCGSALALANGYPMAFLPESMRFDAYPNFLYDPDQAEQIPGKYEPTDHTPEAAVERVAESGAICTKAFLEDGFGRASIWPVPGPEMLQQVLTESRRRQLTMSLHANSYESHRVAAELGVDVVVHGLWNWDALDGEDGVPAPITEVLDQYAEKGVGIMPTLQVLAGLRDLFDPDYLDDPLLSRALPAKLIDYYRSEKGGWFAEQMRQEDFAGMTDPQIWNRFDFVFRQGARVTRALADRDADLLFGSDTPSGPTYANPPGLNGLFELRQLASVGVSPEKIFAMATRDNAEAFHLSDRFGTVEPGKVANLLLLEENPLETVEAWNRIDRVILRGSVLARESLAADAER